MGPANSLHASAYYSEYNERSDFNLKVRLYNCFWKSTLTLTFHMDRNGAERLAISTKKCSILVRSKRRNAPALNQDRMLIGRF